MTIRIRPCALVMCFIWFVAVFLNLSNFKVCDLPFPEYSSQHDLWDSSSSKGDCRRVCVCLSVWKSTDGSYNWVIKAGLFRWGTSCGQVHHLDTFLHKLSIDARQAGRGQFDPHHLLSIQPVNKEGTCAAFTPYHETAAASPKLHLFLTQSLS